MKGMNARVGPSGYAPSAFGEVGEYTREVIIANAFSLGMLRGDADLEIREVNLAQARHFLIVDSVVGHESTAEYFSDLGLRIRFQGRIPAQRADYHLEIGDSLLVGQVQGRLPEGKILSLAEMPEVRWYLVTRHETEEARQQRLRARQEIALQQEKEWEDCPEE